MGLFSKLKKQMLAVIEWNDSTKNTIVYRYPLTERDEIMNSSTLIVRPSQMAIFVHKGEIADVFAPGTYKLSTENVPIITKLASLPTGFNSPIKAEIYFVNTKQMIGQKWGTQNPIMMRDDEFGNVRIRAYGIYSFKVSDGKKFMQEVFGTNQVFTTEDVCTQIKPLLIQSFTDAVAESKMSALDLATNYNEFSSKVKEECTKNFDDLGLKIASFVIENISLPENVEEALDERTRLGVLEDKMGTFTQYQAAKAMRDAAKNESGTNLAGIGVGLGAGVGIGQVFSEAMQNAENKPKTKRTKRTEPAEEAPKKVCIHCGSEIDEKSKFCPECGKKVEVEAVCPKCGTKVGPRTRFCPECGEKLK